MKLKIRKGSKVEIITGADKGHKGTVLAVNVDTMRVRVEGARIQTRHSKQNGLTKSEGFIAYSNVKLIEEAAAAPKKKTAKKASKTA
ncbi:MAG: 50S ribosomal protein L24 [Proteobacteria bacterium]|nr:MAG: 50S ribosomal protein L24 [Pseudomonadota bacterium]